jgi:6-phospho-beta-glucosidase
LNGYAQPSLTFTADRGNTCSLLPDWQWEVKMPPMTLAVLGGSSVATPELFHALLQWPSDARRALRVVLLGRSERKLEQVRQLCQRLVSGAEPPIQVEATTNWRAGLAGAEYVLNQVRIGGLAARVHDETFPQALGIAGEETIGPGGFANALRTLPAVLEMLRLVEEVTPQAKVLNLTNPAGMVQHAASISTHMHLISLCDSPTALADDVAKLLELSREDFDIDYVGMNHLGWITRIDGEDGKLMERALETIEQLPHLGVDSAYIRATRAIPIPYVRYYLHPERMLAQQQGKTPRARQLQTLEKELLAAFEQAEAEGDPSVVLGRRGALWYSAIVVPVLDAMINDRKSIQMVNAVNKDQVPWLPPETVIEVPARIGKQGTQMLPVPADTLSADLRALLYAQAAYEALAVPAIVEQKRDLALQALVAHPLIRSIEQAEAVLQAVWPTGGVEV